MIPNWNRIAATVRDNAGLDGFLVRAQGGLYELAPSSTVINLLPEHRWLCLEGREGAGRVRKWLFAVHALRAWEREGTVVWCGRVDGTMWVGVGAVCPLQTAERFARLTGTQPLVGAAA